MLTDAFLNYVSRLKKNAKAAKSLAKVSTVFGRRLYLDSDDLVTMRPNEIYLRATWSPLETEFTRLVDVTKVASKFVINKSA